MDDCQCHGNLGFSGSQFLIGIVVTHANILTSLRSSGPRGSAFSAEENALLPRMNFTEEANVCVMQTLAVGEAHLEGGLPKINLREGGDRAIPFPPGTRGAHG